MKWWNDLLDRWGWSPPEQETLAKERRAEELHKAAVEMRTEVEASQRRLKPLIERVERMAEAYAREDAMVRRKL
jgi:uncharacterized coiled-coil protein SlyX